VGRRVAQLSTTFRRSVIELGLAPGSPGFRAVFATVAALANADDLPGVADIETTFGPGRAFVRRVGARNVWILYRFDDRHLYAMTTRDRPPVPAAIDDERLSTTTMTQGVSAGWDARLEAGDLFGSSNASSAKRENKMTNGPSTGRSKGCAGALLRVDNELFCGFREAGGVRTRRLPLVGSATDPEGGSGWGGTAEEVGQILDIFADPWEGPRMATPSSPGSVSVSADVGATAPKDESDLLAEILAAEADFERGDYIELTAEQLRLAIETGEFPWPDESLD
jgi:hypothetical protein